MIDNNTNNKMSLNNEYSQLNLPYDYITCPKYEKPLIYQFNDNNHQNCSMFRIYWKTGLDSYLPISFVCTHIDSSYLCLSPMAKNALYFRILIDDHMHSYMLINGKQILVSDTPTEYLPSNIISLSMLSKLGLKLDKNLIAFDNELEYL